MDFNYLKTIIYNIDTTEFDLSVDDTTSIPEAKDVEMKYNTGVKSITIANVGVEARVYIHSMEISYIAA